MRINAETHLLAHIFLRRRLSLQTLMVRHLHSIDPIEQADHGLLQGVEKRRSIFVAEAAFRHKPLNQPAHFVAALRARQLCDDAASSCVRGSIGDGFHIDVGLSS